MVVDKPRGPTSHDVVAQLRRRLDTGRVGHAGTLDPMATGVLVAAVGEGTKLVPYLTAADKRYRATLRLGEATDTLDAEGEVIGTGPLVSADREAVQAMADSFLGRHLQRAPRVSAIKVDGERLHAKARRGEDFEAPEREVELHSVSILSVAPDAIAFELEAAKGFYVRSFGRDLAQRLGTVGHLTELRRLASGRFGLDDAVSLDTVDPAALLSPAEAAARVMPTIAVDGPQAADLRLGRRIPAREDDPSGTVALVHDGVLVAVGTRAGDSWQVSRGFAPPASAPLR